MMSFFAGWLWHMGSFSVSSHFHSSVSVIDSQTTGYICKLGDVKCGSQLQTKNKTNWIIEWELDATGSWFPGTFNPSVIRGVPAQFYKDCINLAVYASVRLLFRFTQPPCPCIAVLNEIGKKKSPYVPGCKKNILTLACQMLLSAVRFKLFYRSPPVR